MSEQPKYTPGPYRVGGQHSVWREPYIDEKGRRIHQPICDCNVPAALSKDERAANAKLHAASWDLLAAAEKARTALDAMMGDTDVDDDESLEFQAMRALNAAIAKATGA